jgi:hypothetical protein
MTTRAKTGIEGVLAKAGVEVQPGLNDPANDGWVTLRLAGAATPAFPQLPAPAAAPQDHAVVAAAAPAAKPRRSLHLRPAPFLAAALAFLVPVLLVIAFASPEANRPGRAGAAEPASTTTAVSTPQLTPLQEADTALLAGDYATAVQLTRRADPAKVPALRARIAASLVSQAATAQRGRAYVRAIQLSRRAARYGRAPGASRIVAQSRAGLDLRREAQRRAARRAATDAG